MNSSWDKLLQGEYGFNPILANKLARKNGHDFPNDVDTFKFATLPINKLKCIIIGMEPYASWYQDANGNIIPQATGRSFEVKELENKDWTYKFKQASLRNIAKCVYLTYTNKLVTSKEFRKEIINKNFIMANPSEWFENLSNQGVCFLNAALTVKKDNPGTGKDYWKDFGKAFTLAVKEKNNNVVWFLFGKDAQNSFLPYLDETIDKVVCGPHPRMTEFAKTPWFAYCKDIDWCGNSK